MHRSLLLILTLAALTTGCGDWTFGRTLEGVVVDSGSRLKATESGAQQKISILINSSEEVIHTSCSTPLVRGEAAPLNDPKGDPSPNWRVVEFTQKN